MKKYFTNTGSNLHIIPGLGQVDLRRLDEKTLRGLFEDGRAFLKITEEGARHFYKKESSKMVCQIIAKRPHYSDIILLSNVKNTISVQKAAQQRIEEITA